MSFSLFNRGNDLAIILNSANCIRLQLNNSFYPQRYNIFVDN